MIVKTFRGKNASDALSQAKRELGPDVMVLKTRTIKTGLLGMRMKPQIEVTVSPDAVPNTPKRLRGRNKRLESTPDPTILARKAALTAYAQKTIQRARENANNLQNETLLPNLAAPAPLRTLHTPLASPAPPSPPITPTMPSHAALAIPSEASMPTPAATKTSQASSNNDDVKEMKAMLKQLIQMHRQDKLSDIPDELMPSYVQLIEQEVVEDLAHGLIKRLKTEVGEEFLKDNSVVQEKLLNNMAQLINVGGPIQVKRGETRVIAMIGPTGVGKTTTIAKLAATLKLKQNVSVGMVTIDTFRIAAVDQIKNYARILDVPLRVVNRPQDIQEALIQLSTCDVVLIDTAGRSHRDYEKMDDLSSFLDHAKPDEVHLVLSSTSSQQSIERIIESFSYCRIDRLILTKLDEAVNLGVILNVLGKVNHSLSYVTTGQSVPDDIEEGEARTLAKMILNQQARQKS